VTVHECTHEAIHLTSAGRPQTPVHVHVHVREQGQTDENHPATQLRSVVVAEADPSVVQDADDFVIVEEPVGRPRARSVEALAKSDIPRIHLDQLDAIANHVQMSSIEAACSC
jgi:hypothetical protein